MISGNSHERGGVKGWIGNRQIELEGGEVVINKRSSELFKPLLSEINAKGGGVRFAAGGVIPYTYQAGGAGSGKELTAIMELIQATNNRIDKLKVVNVVSEVTTIQNEQKTVYQSSVI